jgi:thiamine pyrophosphokinase
MVLIRSTISGIFAYFIYIIFFLKPVLCIDVKITILIVLKVLLDFICGFLDSINSRVHSLFQI